ncbi:uncharacterized protein DEA37_0010334 [Paragonimus westermani]|uniref:Uncharacterized protein n=1 Tax=Paragonimus westermani TaxID=34504 RepID=A0A5J4NDY9_9TREM|nr:uncharacterized protein DEA37_0010334 [Paragonimus westermani]
MRSEKSGEVQQMKASQLKISPRGLNMRGCEIQTIPMIEHVSCTVQAQPHGHTPRSKASHVRMETRGTSSERVSLPTVQFTPSITYAERLMLRVHRRNQLPAVSATNTSSRPNWEPEQLEPVKDFQPSSSSWQRPDFTQLHALATSNMRTEDFCIEFQMEDLENTSDSSSTTVQRPTSAEMNIASTSKRTNGNVELLTYKTTEGDTTQVDILQDTTVVSKEDFARVDGGGQSKMFILNAEARLILCI